MSIFEIPSCALLMAGVVCLLLGLIVGVRSIFVIRESRGRLRGYGHAILAIVFSLLPFPLLMFVMLLGTGSLESHGGTAPTAIVRSQGLGRSAADHGPNCRDIRAALKQRADLFKSEALEPIAERGDLTTHEQMHLVDIVIDDMSADVYRKEVLVRLARNPALTAEGRSYLIENLGGMSADVFRSEVLKALKESKLPNTR